MRVTILSLIIITNSFDMPYWRGIWALNAMHSGARDSHQERGERDSAAKNV